MSEIRVGVVPLVLLELQERYGICLAGRADATVIAVIAPEPDLATPPDGRAKVATCRGSLPYPAFGSETEDFSLLLSMLAKPRYRHFLDLGAG
jgi:hypothetical protein